MVLHRWLAIAVVVVMGVPLAYSFVVEINVELDVDNVNCGNNDVDPN